VFRCELLAWVAIDAAFVAQDRLLIENEHMGCRGWSVFERHRLRVAIVQVRKIETSVLCSNFHIAREREARAEKIQEQTRMKSTLVIAAAIIAAVRLARDPDISRPSPRLTAVVSESVSLARMILDRVGGQ
jgi:hypothetical protein